ncbi:MAG: hypothetical protein WBG63_00705 [Phormidesmis sp.]
MKKMPFLQQLFAVAMPLVFGLSASPSLAGTVFVQPARPSARPPVSRSTTVTRPITVKGPVNVNRPVSVNRPVTANRPATATNRLPSLFQLPRSAQPLPPLTLQATSIATLPDGNYRVAALASRSLYPSFYTTNPYSASTLFTFRKLGNVITGNFEYLDNGLEACISGTVEGNTIVGQAYTNSGETFRLNQSYLGPDLSLQLGNAVTFNRYDASVLNLNGFTRINSGTTTPPAVCS